MLPRVRSNSIPTSALRMLCWRRPLIRLGRVVEARAVAQRVLALQPTFTICKFSVTIGLAPEVYARHGGRRGCRRNNGRPQATDAN